MAHAPGPGLTQVLFFREREILVNSATCKYNYTIIEMFTFVNVLFTYVIKGLKERS